MCCSPKCACTYSTECCVSAATRLAGRPLRRIPHAQRRSFFVLAPSTTLTRPRIALLQPTSSPGGLEAEGFRAIFFARTNGAGSGLWRPASRLQRCSGALGRLRRRARRSRRAQAGAAACRPRGASAQAAVDKGPARRAVSQGKMAGGGGSSCRRRRRRWLFLPLPIHHSSPSAPF